MCASDEMLKLTTPPGRFAVSVEASDLQVSSKDFIYIYIKILGLLS